MKKTFLLLIAFAFGCISFGQTPGPHPLNIDVGIFNNGVNGSNVSSGAYLELSLRIRTGGLTYTAIPAANDWVVYLIAPKTDFAETDVVSVMQANATLYGTASTTVMLSQGGVVDIGDPTYFYIPLVLNNAPGMNLSPLSTAGWTFAFTIRVQTSGAVDRTPVQHRMIRIIDQTNNAFLSALIGTPTYTHLDVNSSNDLTPAAFTVLPVNLLNFSGYKNGSRNVLRWTTANEQNNMGFEVQRSLDGVNYAAIGFVNSLAPGGTSTIQLNYAFDDNNPVGKKQYYRLKQTDFDGGNKLSNVVRITGDKQDILGIGGLFPNPASTVVNVIIDAPAKDKVTILVSDMNGKKVKQQLANVDIGSNTVAVDIASLASGSYLVKLLCQESDCEVAAAKFNKQ